MAERGMAHEDFEPRCSCDCPTVCHCLHKVSEETVQSMGFGTVWFIGAVTMGIWFGYIGFEAGICKEDH